MTTGRTLGKYVKLQIDDGTAMRDLNVLSIGDVGISYEEVDVSAINDVIKGFLNGLGTVAIPFTCRFDNTAAATASGTGEAPAFSGSHILAAIAGSNTGRSAAIYFGIQGYWATGDPVFGGVDSFILGGYTVSADGVVSSKLMYKTGATVPAWGTAAIAAS